MTRWSDAAKWAGGFAQGFAFIARAALTAGLFMLAFAAAGAGSAGV